MIIRLDGRTGVYQERHAWDGEEARCSLNVEKTPSGGLPRKGNGAVNR